MAAIALNLFGLYTGSGGFTNSFVLGAAGMLFGGSNKQVIEGPRQRDLSPPQSRVGNPIPKVFGEMPVTGDIIWAEKIREIKTVEEEGGKGTPSVESITYNYSATFAVKLCKGPIKRLKKIYIGDKLWWDYNGGDEIARGDKFGEKIGGSYFTYDAATGTYTSNNGLWRIRTGTETQLPDADEEADKGVGKVPAYRGDVVLNMTDLNVTKFGGRHPQISVLVDEGTTNVASICNWICEEVGLVNGTDFEMCELAGSTLRGFIIDERIEARSPLERIGLAFMCDFPERDFMIRAMKRGRVPTLEIPYEDLRTHDLNAAPADDRWKRSKVTAIPETVEVSHLDAARHHTANSQLARREITVPGSDKMEIDLSSMSLSGPQARRVAEIKMATLATEQLSAGLHLAPPYAYLAACDVVIPTIAGTRHAVLLQEAQESLFGVLAFQAIGYDPNDYDWPLDEEGEGLPDTAVEATNGVYWAFLDINSPTDAQNDKPYLFLAATVPYGESFDSAKTFSFAWENTTDKLEREISVKIDGRASIGSAVNELGVHPLGGVEGGGDEVAEFDDTNTLTVDMIDGELSSATDAQLLADESLNVAVLGQEYIRWGVAEFLGDQSDGRKRYKLSHLVRGLRGSETFMDEHESGEVFVVVNSALQPVAYKRGSIDSPFEIRAVDDKADVLSVVVQPRARNLWPYAPHFPQGERDGSNNLTISWSRRSRYSDASWWASGSLPPLGETSELYDVEILDGSGNVIRTATDLSSPEYSYSAAAQTGDGLTPGDDVTFRVYQKSEIIGRGYPLLATV